MKIETKYVCEICKKKSISLPFMEKHEKECIKKNQKKADFILHRIERIDEFRNTLNSFYPDVIAELLQNIMNKNLETDIIIKLTDMKHEFNLSNSHSCPIDGVENWHADKDKPTGYPGFRGMISFYITPEDYDKYNDQSFYLPSGVLGNDMRYTDLFTVRGIHTGSGGSGGGEVKGGRKHFRYDFKMFIQDFPILYPIYKEIVVAKEAVHLLSGGSGRIEYEFKV